VCWISLDPAKGSEIGKTRPGVVVSNDINNEFAATVTVVPITSKTGKVYPFEVFMPKGMGGLKENSKAKANQIRTVDKKRIKRVIGQLPMDLMNKIDEAVKIHLNI
jgi:mRNA interferase MazF